MNTRPQQWAGKLVSLLIFMILGGSAPLVKARDWNTIQHSGVLRIGINPHYPLAFLDSQGKWVGYEIDLAHTLAELILGSSDAVELIPLSSAELVAAVAGDRLDLAIAHIPITPGLARLVDFSPPYYRGGTGLLVLDQQAHTHHWSRWSDLGSRSIAVLPTSQSIPRIRAYLRDVTLVQVSNYHEGIAALMAGQVAGFAADHSLLTGWMQQHGVDQPYRFLGADLHYSSWGIALPKTRASLSLKITAQIEHWQTSGWLEELARRWQLPVEDYPATGRDPIAD